MSSQYDRVALTIASDEALLLREICLRTSAEVAGATAAIMLANGASPLFRRDPALKTAAARLEACTVVQRLLARPVASRVELAADIEALCLALASGRPEARAGRIDLDLDETWTTGLAARRLLIIAARLFDEAIRCALHTRAGRAHVVLNAAGGIVTLTIEDDGSGPRTLNVGDDGGAIIVELLRRGDGTIGFVTGRRGTRVTVSMSNGLEVDDEIPF